MFRSLALPRRAMLDTLSDLARRIETAERRAVWSPAVQDDTQSYDWYDFTPVQNIGDPGYPQADATAVCALTLDPGRWVLLGQATHEVYVEGGVAELGMILSWQDGVTGGERISTRRAVTSPTAAIEGSPSLAIEVISERQITASLKVFAGSFFGFTFGFEYMQSARLLAFPG